MSEIHPHGEGGKFGRKVTKDMVETDAQFRRTGILVAGPSWYTTNKSTGGPKIEPNRPERYCPKLKVRLAATAMNTRAGSRARIVGCATYQV